MKRDGEGELQSRSIAMLLAEERPRQAESPSIQVFATDLDVHALAVAREGNYSDADVADVSEERLRRFFQPVRGGHRIFALAICETQ